MSKQTAIIAAAICLVVVLAAGLFFMRPSLEKIDINRARPPEAINSAPQVLTKVFSQETDAYRTEVEYPELQNVSASGVRERINGEIKTSVYNQIAGFHEANAQNSALGDPEFKSSFDADFDVILLTRSFFSGMMSYSDYSSGAAHPNSYKAALNYNLKTGEAMTLDQVLRELKPSAGYMDRLVQYVRKDLVRQFGDSQDSLEIINFGTAPKPENYANFTLDMGGLSLHFEPYQVAPYAAGSPTVRIPYGELTSAIIKPANAETLATSSLKWWLE